MKLMALGAPQPDAGARGGLLRAPRESRRAAEPSPARTASRRADRGSAPPSKSPRPERAHGPVDRSGRRSWRTGGCDRADTLTTPGRGRPGERGPPVRRAAARGLTTITHPAGLIGRRASAGGLSTSRPSSRRCQPGRCADRYAPLPPPGRSHARRRGREDGRSGMCADMRKAAGINGGRQETAAEDLLQRPCRQKMTAAARRCLLTCGQDTGRCQSCSAPVTAGITHGPGKEPAPASAIASQVTSTTVRRRAEGGQPPSRQRSPSGRRPGLLDAACQ